MAGFGTSKPGFMEAIQLTFPRNFSEAYEQRRMGAAFAPGGAHAGKQDYVGKDEMAQIHEARRAEAHRMVRAGVEATNNAEKRANMSHAGYYNLPPVVLSQRRIGSMYGVGGGFNTSIDRHESLHGGVIGSPEGRMWVKDALRRRRAELDAIDANEFGMPLSRAVSKGEPPSEFSDIARVELSSFLSQLYAQIQSNSLTFSPETFRRFFALFIRFSTVASKEEMDDVKARLDEIKELLLAGLGARLDAIEFDPEAWPGVGFYEFLGVAITASLRYFDTMYGVLFLSPKERKDASKAALKSSGLAKLNVFAQRQGLSRMIPPPAQLYDDNISIDTISEGSSTTSSSSSSAPSSGVGFSRPGVSAEISSGPTFASTAPWSNTNRDQFGRQGGPTEMRGVRTFAGEEGEDEADRQAQQDYEAQVEEAAVSGVDSALSRLRQSNVDTDQDFKEGESMLAGPPTTSWVDTSDVAQMLRAEIGDASGIEPFLAGYVGQAGLPGLRALANDLRAAKGLRALSSDDIYQVKKQLRPLLGELF